MYGEDTFFQLESAARIGVLVLSALVGALVLWVSWRMARVLIALLTPRSRGPATGPWVA